MPGGLAPRGNANRRASPPGFDPTGGKSGTEIVGELASGAGSGVGKAVASALSVDVLRVPAGLFHVVGSAWESGDPIEGLSALFWKPGAAQVDAVVASAVDGDFKGAAEAGVKVVTIGVATGVALGELGGAAVDAAKGAKEAGTAGGPRAGRSFTAKDKREGFERFQEADGTIRCANCGSATVPAEKSARGVTPSPKERQGDHIIPKVAGGDGSASNFQPLCRTCNRQKSGKTP